MTLPLQGGLNYICATAERFFAVGAVLGNMVAMLAEQPSVRLLKHIIRCYLRLSDNPRAREALRQCLPELLRNPQFTSCLKVPPLVQDLWFLQLRVKTVGREAGNPPAESGDEDEWDRTSRGRNRQKCTRTERGERNETRQKSGGTPNSQTP